MPSRNLLLAGALALAAGCAEPEDNPTDFQYLHATVIGPRCATAGCHSYGNAQLSTSITGPINLSSATDPSPGDNTVSDHGACKNLQDWVTPLPAICGSEPEVDLMRLLDGTYGDNGCDYAAIPEGYTQMPADFPLTSAEKNAVKHWIEAGAPCD